MDDHAESSGMEMLVQLVAAITTAMLVVRARSVAAELRRRERALR